MSSVWKDAVLLQYGEEPEELQGVGPRRWTKALMGPDWSKKEGRTWVSEWKWLWEAIFRDPVESRRAEFRILWILKTSEKGAFGNQMRAA